MTHRLLMFFLALPFTLHAHDAWLHAVPGGFAVQYGDNWKAEPYRPDKVKDVRAVDAAGKPLAVRLDKSADAVVAAVDGHAALLSLRYDNGFYSRVGNGKAVNLAMTENPGATSGVHPLKLHKSILQWVPAALSPVGFELEILPAHSNSAAPAIGQPHRFRVLRAGAPAANLKVGTGEHDVFGETDAAGEFAYTPTRKGRHTLWVGQRETITGDARFTELSLAATLFFWVNAP